MRADAKRCQRNLMVKSELKTLTRKLLSQIQEGKGEAVQTYQRLSKRLDQAAQRNIMHRNTASRKKSRLGRRLTKLTKPA